MSDLILGVIIGGLIGLVGSAVQGYFALKTKKEENLARQQQQSIQIQHEKHIEHISRVIKVRERYLNPISDELNKLHVSLSDLREKLLILIVPYLDEKPEEPRNPKVKVEAAEKNQFIHELESVDKTLSVIETGKKRIHEACLRLTDMELRDLLSKVPSDIYSMQKVYDDMAVDLAQSKTGHDFIYDFAQILEPVSTVNISIAHAAKRIESLLAGVDAGDA